MALADYEALPEKRASVLRNVTCPYCGEPFTAARPATLEHVVGRRFVPRGCLDGQWNLILNACGRCNGDKAALEDDISAISLQPDHEGRFAVDDPRLAAEAARKAQRSISRRTGKAVKDSRETLTIPQTVAGAEIAFTFVAAAQVETQRIWELARFHWRGLFYFATYDDARRTGGFVRGPFCPVATVRRHDWGNPRMLAFAERVRAWPPLINGTCADGFFRFSLREDPDHAGVASWAFEWNQNIRAVGFVGERAAIDALREALPWPEVSIVAEGPDHTTGLRRNIALDPADDQLFTVEVGDGDAGLGAA